MASSTFRFSPSIYDEVIEILVKKGMIDDKHMEDNVVMIEGIAQGLSRTIRVNFGGKIYNFMETGCHPIYNEICQRIREMNMDVEHVMIPSF